MEFEGIIQGEIFWRVIIGIALLILGIFVGKGISILLKKFSKKFEFEKKIRPSFLRLIILIIELSIYIAFISLGIRELRIDAISELVGNTLLVIPSIVASLIIVSMGFLISTYLQEVIEDSEITGWRFFSKYLFYFVNLISLVYALRVAFVTFDPSITKIIIILTIGISFISIAYTHVKKELKEFYNKN